MSRHEVERQRLLARIAFERLQLAREVARVRQRVRLPPLLQAIARSAVSPRADAAGGWLGAVLAVLRRYPVAASLLGLVSPLLRRRRGLRRAVALAAVVAGAAFAWRAKGSIRPPPPSPR